MNNHSTTTYTTRALALMGSFLMALCAILVLGYTTAAAPLEADLSGSTKTVDKAEATPGETLQYTIVISNSGGDFADITMAYLTDTLPAALTYVSDTLTASTGTAAVASAGVITWSGGLGSLDSAVVSFEAVLDESATVGQQLTNTVEITGTMMPSATLPLLRTAVTTVISPSVAPPTSEVFLPILSLPLQPIVLQEATRPTSNNEWSLTWTTHASPYLTGYEFQESRDPAFANAADITTINTLSNSITRNPAISARPIYYYRVRPVTDSSIGAWSNVVRVIGVYYDDFSDANSGWRRVRQDNDDSVNDVFYINGYLNLEMDSRWDYQIASSLVEVPAPPYRIEARIGFDGPDNLHSAGLIFGANWNGGACPSFSGCFYQYHRLQIIWHGAPSSLRASLKRIETHDDKNEGRGETLGDFTDVGVGSPSGGFKTWRVEVYPDGRILVWGGGTLVYDVVDPSYLDHRYFGGFAATDEYTGLDVQWDWVRVTPLDN